MEYAIFYRKGEAWPDVGSRYLARKAQRDYMTEGARHRLVLAFGYLDGDEALAFIECPTRVQAQQYTECDPAVLAHVYCVELREFESE